MRMSFLIVITACLLLLGLGIAWDSTAGCGVVSAALQYIGEVTSAADPRPEAEKNIFTRVLNAIAMRQHRQGVNVRGGQP